MDEVARSFAEEAELEALQIDKNDLKLVFGRPFARGKTSEVYQVTHAGKNRAAKVISCHVGPSLLGMQVGVLVLALHLLSFLPRLFFFFLFRVCSVFGSGGVAGVAGVAAAAELLSKPEVETSRSRMNLCGGD